MVSFSSGQFLLNDRIIRLNGITCQKYIQLKLKYAADLPHVGTRTSNAHPFGMKKANKKKKFGQLRLRARLPPLNPPQ